MSRWLATIILLISITRTLEIRSQILLPESFVVLPTSFGTGMPSVFELLSTRYRFENDGTGSKEVIAKIRILTQTGIPQFAEQSFRYHPMSEELIISYVRLRKKNGSVLNFETNVGSREPAGLTANIDLDERRVRIPGLAVGDLVEYDVITIFHHPLGTNEFCVQHSFQPSGVLDEQLFIEIPVEREIKLKTVANLKVLNTLQGKHKVYQWENRNSKAEQVLSIPYTTGRTPDVQMSSFLSWEEIGHWYSEFERRHRVPSEDVKAKADELTNGLSTNIEKIEALYNFVAKKVRYISLSSLGVGGYEPHSAAETIHKGYGDCKDKTALLRALLEAEGLHAASALISSDRKLDIEMPSPWYFDHAITVLQLGDRTIWMDPSLAVLPFGMLAYSIRGRQALVLPPEAEPHFQTTPFEATVANTWRQEIDGKMSENGVLDAIVRITAGGDAEIPIRQAFLGQSESSWSMVVQSLVAGIDRKTDKVSDVTITDPTNTKELFALSFHLTKPHFAAFSDGSLHFSLPLSQIDLPPMERIISGPIRLGAPGDRSYRVLLRLPRGYSIVPIAFVKLSTEGLTYSASYNPKADSIICERRLITTMDKIPVEVNKEYADFHLKVMADIDRVLSATFVAAQN